MWISAWSLLTLLPPLAPQGTPLAVAAPRDAMAWLEVSDPVGLAGQLLEHPWVEGIPGMEEPLALIRDQDFREFLDLLDSEVDGGLPQLARDLFGSGLGLGLVASEGGGEPEFWLGLRGPDAGASKAALERLFDLVLDASDLPRALIRPREVAGGATLYRFGGEFAVGLRGADIVLSSTPRRVEESLAGLAKGTDPGLLGNTRFQTAMSAVSRDADAALWLDLESWAASLPERRTPWRNLAHDPTALFLLGTSVASVASAPTVTLALDLSARDARIRIDANGPATTPIALAPKSPAPPAPFPVHERDVLRAALHRDVAGLIAGRGDLFEPSAIADFSASLAEISILFAGVDLEADVIPMLDPWIHIVARPLAPSKNSGDPSPRLVAAAASLRVGDPELLGPVLESAFQSAVALSTAERAQRGERSYLLRVGSEAGRAYSYGQLPRLPEGEPIGIEYNLAPAFAMRGDRMILATHVELLRELLAETEATSPADSATAASEHLHFDAAPLVGLVDGQVETWVELLALTSGRSRQGLRGELERWTDSLGEASLSLTTRQTSEHVAIEAKLEGWR